MNDKKKLTAVVLQGIQNYKKRFDLELYYEETLIECILTSLLDAGCINPVGTLDNDINQRLKLLEQNYSDHCRENQDLQRKVGALQKTVDDLYLCRKQLPM